MKLFRRAEQTHKIKLAKYEIERFGAKRKKFWPAKITGYTVLADTNLCNKYILLHGVECNMVRYCTSGLLYFTSQRRVKYSPQVQCLTILHSTPCNDKFIILSPKEMATTVATRAGAAMVEVA